MDLDRKKKFAKKAYKPYFFEARHCFMIYVLVSLIISVLFIAFSMIYDTNTIPFLVSVLVIYLIADCLLNYRLSFMAMLEMKSLHWNKQELTIVKISKDYAWSGYLWTSVLPKLYPKEQRVDKYKLICKEESGENIVLRSVMSGKKYQIIQDRIFDSMPTKCTIYYGKISKIIMYYKNDEPWTDILNHNF